MAGSEPRSPAEFAFKIATDLAAVAAHQLDGILPTEARLHLVRAQRELLLAALATLEHHREPPRRRRRRQQVRKIPLD